MEDNFVQALWNQYPNLSKAQRAKLEKKAQSEEMQKQVALSIAEGQHKQNLRQSAQNARQKRKDANKVVLPYELNPTGAEVIVSHPDKFTTCYTVRAYIQGDLSGTEEAATDKEASPDGQPIQTDTSAKRSKKR